MSLVPPNIDEMALIDKVKINGRINYIIESLYFKSNVPEGFESWVNADRQTVLEKGLFFRKNDFPNIGHYTKT